jgi:hypothetical protein
MGFAAPEELCGCTDVAALLNPSYGTATSLDVAPSAPARAL